MSNFVSLILLFAVLGFAGLMFMHSLKKASAEKRAISSEQAPKMPRVPVAAFAWPELGEYDFEVVGESNYQHVLKALMGDPNDPEMDGRGTAILVPEDTNPYDDKAVKVTVQGFTVGYLSREDARSFRRRLAAKKLGMVPTSCGFQITGGYPLEDGSQAFFGAQLDLKPFD